MSAGCSQSGPPSALPMPLVTTSIGSTTLLLKRPREPRRLVLSGNMAPDMVLV